jgi:hypothetical protein
MGCDKKVPFCIDTVKKSGNAEAETGIAQWHEQHAINFRGNGRITREEKENCCNCGFLND